MNRRALQLTPAGGPPLPFSSEAMEEGKRLKMKQPKICSICALLLVACWVSLSYAQTAETEAIDMAIRISPEAAVMRNLLLLSDYLRSLESEGKTGSAEIRSFLKFLDISFRTKGSNRWKKESEGKLKQLEKILAGMIRKTQTVSKVSQMVVTSVDNLVQNRKNVYPDSVQKHLTSLAAQIGESVNVCIYSVGKGNQMVGVLVDTFITIPSPADFGTKFSGLRGQFFQISTDCRQPQSTLKTLLNRVIKEWTKRTTIPLLERQSSMMSDASQAYSLNGRIMSDGGTVASFPSESLANGVYLETIGKEVKKRVILH